MSKIFRSFKYLRIFIILLEKSFWKEGNYLIVCIGIAVNRIKLMIVMWLIVILTLTIMGYELHTGKTLMDSNGELDLISGTPNQINNSSIYHSFIFTTLAVFNEEWDVFMFQEYVGSGIIAILWGLLTMIFGYLIFSK